MSLADDARALAARTRRSQGLPEVVRDHAVLAKVATILAGSRNGNGAPLRAPAPGLASTTTDLTRAGDRVPH